MKTNKRIGIKPEEFETRFNPARGEDGLKWRAYGWRTEADREAITYAILKNRIWTVVWLGREVIIRSGRIEASFADRHCYIITEYPWDQVYEIVEPERDWEPRDNWEIHTDYPLDSWKKEVAEDVTRMGYVDWVGHNLAVIYEDYRSKLPKK